jgi:hypothetical protein
VDLKQNGAFRTRMAAKAGSGGFDFEGTFTLVDYHKKIHYEITGGRKVKIEFITMQDKVQIIETFEIETQNTFELQQNCWQAILDNFKRYVEVFDN